jgi:hypothetical protein
MPLNGPFQSKNVRKGDCLSLIKDHSEESLIYNKRLTVLHGRRARDGCDDFVPSDIKIAIGWQEQLIRTRRSPYESMRVTTGHNVNVHFKVLSMRRQPSHGRHKSKQKGSLIICHPRDYLPEQDN